MKKLLLLILLLVPLKAYSATYYVRGDAAGGGNGTTDANSGAAGAWTWVEFQGVAATIDDDDIMYIRGRNPADESTFTYTSTANIGWAGEDGAYNKMYHLFGFWDTPGDLPTYSQRPTIALGAYYFNPGDYWDMRYLNWTGTGTIGVVGGTYNCHQDVSIINTSSSSASYALSVSGYSNVVNSRIEKDGKGIAVRTITANVLLYACYLYDAEYGITNINGGNHVLVNNIFNHCDEAMPATGVAGWAIGNTFYDCNTSAAYLNASGAIIGNIITESGLAIVCTAAGTETLFIDYNNLYSNTTDYTNIDAVAQTRKHSLAVDPAFTDAANEDFSVGASMQAKSIPGDFCNSNTTGYNDMGAVQRIEPSGSAGTVSHGGFGQ